MKTPFPTLSDENFLNSIQNLTSLISEGVIVTDTEENILWVNSALEKMSGYKLEKIRGKKINIFHGKNTNKKSVRSIRKSLEKKEKIDTELLNYRPDGTAYWVRLTVASVLNENNELTNFIAFEHDITEQKSKYLALSDSDVLYKTLFDKSPSMMLIFDPKTYQILEVNDAALRVYGYTRDEFLKLTIKDIRPEEDWEKVKKIMPKVKDNFVMQGVWRHYKKNREIIFVEIKATEINFKGKKTILVIPTDVTDRIKKEEEIKYLNSNLIELNNELSENLHATEILNRELKIKQQNLKTAQNTAKIGTWEINVKTNSITCSEEIYKIFEFPHGKKLSFDAFQKKIHPDDLSMYTTILDEVINKNVPMNMEFRIRLSKGRHKHLVSQGALILDEKGKPDLISGITLDVTAKKHAEELIKAQLKNINIILGSINEPFYIIDRKYKLLFINDASAKLSGYPKEELIGKNIWDLYPDRDLTQDKKQYAKALKENKPYQFETEYFGKSFSVNLYPSEIGLAITARDITEKKKREYEILEQSKFIKEISDNTPGGIIQTVYHPDGEVEASFISEGFEELWGMSIDEVKYDVSKRYDAIHPEDREVVKREVESAIKNVQALNHKFRYINQKPQEIKWVRAKAVPNKRDDGSVVLNGVFIDITESEKYYSELEKSNERYKYISIASQEGIWDWDLTTGIVSIGGNYVEMMKAPEGVTEITHEQFIEVIHKDDAERINKSFDKFMLSNSEKLWEDTFRVVNFVGETLTVYGRGYVVYDESTNKPVRIVGSTFNVTEKVKAEAEIKEKAKFIEEIGDNIPGALFKEIIYPDGNLKIEYLSEGFEKFWGVPVQELMKDPMKKVKFIHPDDLETVKKSISSLSDKSKLNDKIRYVNQKTGEIFWVNINAVASDNGDGGIVLTGVVIDISDTEKYYNELEKSNRRYEYVSKAANETIWDWDLKTNKMELSGNYVKMFGYNFPDNIVDFSFVLNRIHPDDISIVENSIKIGISDLENHYRENYYRMLNADNSVMHIYERSYTIFDPVTKEALKIIGTAQDITDKKKYEEEIKEKAKFIHEIGDNIPGALFETEFYKDATYKHLYLSIGFEKFWGVSVDKVLNDVSSKCEFVHPDDSNLLEGMAANLEDKQKVNVKYRYVNSVTKEIFWVRLNAIANITEEGNFLLTGVIIDVTETEKYYNELEKSNERYEYVSKAANEGMWDWDLTTNMITVGGNFNEMMKSKVELKEITFEMLQGTMHPEDLPRVDKKFMEFLSDPSQRYWEDTFRLINLDGEIVHVYERGYAIYDEVLNKPIRFVGSAFDITQRKKDEEAIKEKVNFIQQVSNNVPGAIFQTVYYSDGSSLMTFASDGFKEFWGVPIESALDNSEKRFALMHPDDVERMKEIVETSIKNLTPNDCKFRYVNQETGKITWVRSKSIPEKMPDGSVILTGVIIDITETEKYYNELEVSNKRYEYVSKASNEIIWDLDLETWETTLGGNYEEILGVKFQEGKSNIHTRKTFIHPDDSERVIKTVDEAINNKDKRDWEIEFRLQTYDGRIINVFERGFVICDEKTGDPIRAMGSTMDITEKKKSEVALKEQLEFMKSISDNFPGGLFEAKIDSKGNLKHYYASEGFEKFWGVPVSEISPNGLDSLRFFHPDDLEIVTGLYQSLSSYSKINHKCRLVNEKTKEVFWVRINANVVVESNGNVTVRGVIIDVTDTEKYYYQLEKSNQRFEYVSKAANESIWDLDLIAGEFTFGGSFKEMFGFEYENNTCKYNEVVNMIHPDDKERVIKSIEDVFENENKRYWEDYYRVIRKGGGIVYVYDRGYVIYDEMTNKPIRFVGATQNITQRKLDEEAMTEQIRKINIIIESISDPFFVFNNNLEVIMINEAALNFTKLNKKDVIGKSFLTLNKSIDHQSAFKMLNESIVEKKSYHEEVQMGGRWFDFLTYPSEIGLAVYAKDITEKKKRQEESEKNIKFIKEISESTPGFLFQLEFDKSLKPTLNYASESAFDYWGIPVKDALEGKEELFKSIPSEDVGRFRNALMDSVSKLTDLNIKYRLVNQITKVVKWVRAAAIPSKLDNGNVLLNGAVIDITEAENYYNKLDEANQRYEHVSKATNNAIWELDLKTGICLMGGAYEEMFGYKLKDNILTSDFHNKMLHPDDLESVKKSKQEALKEKSNRYWERTYRIIRADGKIIYVNDRAYIVYEEGNENPIKIIGSTQDITDNVMHEIEQKKNEKFLTEISESMQGFIFQTEYDNNYVAKLNYASKNASDYWGVSVEEVMADQSKLLDSIHFEDITDVVNKRLESVKNLTVMNLKFRYVNKQTGEIKWVHAMAVPTRLDNGHTLVNGTIIDITETENYYNMLEEATRRYEYLSKATHETIWEMDLVTNEILLGGGYREMFGEQFSGNKISFSKWEKYVHPDDLENIKNSMEEVISDQAKRYWESSYRLIRTDGKIIDVFERAYIVYNEKNLIPLKIIGSTQDVTEFNKIQEERDKMFEDLLKRNKALEQFTYMVSHNLRAPIANILGISALLEENHMDEETRLEMNQLIKKSSSRLDEVIRDMNDILTIRQRFDEDKCEVVFDTILSEIKNIEEHAIENSGIKIISDFSKLRSMYSIKSFIYSIFQNLITNGVKYKKEGASFIKLTSSEDKENIYLEFEDNGIGIDLKKHKEKIFGLYNRFHLHKEGKGMGLFMVKNQVEAMNGEISVESEIDKGTKFKIKFRKNIK